MHSKAIEILKKLIKHTAILNLAIDGNQRARDEANESWRCLPDDLTAAIEVQETAQLEEWTPKQNNFINQRFNKVD